MMKHCLTFFSLCLVWTAQAQNTAGEALLQGEKLMQTGYYPEAIAAFTRAIGFDPAFVEAYYNRALAKKTSGDLQGAAQDYNRALQLKPTHYNALVNRGVLYDEMGNKADAMKDYDKAISLEPNRPVAYNNRGFAEYQRRNFKKAQEDFDLAIQKDSTYITPYINKLSLLEATGKGDLIVQHCALMVRKFPANETAYLNVGESFVWLGDYPNALLSFDRAIQLKPDFYDAYIARAKFRDDHGYDDEGAITDCNKAIALQPHQAMAYYIRSRPKYDMKDHAGVIADCNKAIELKPDFYEAILMRGNSYDITGNFDLAIKDYDRCIELKPLVAEAYFQKSVALFLQKKYPELETMLDDAVKKIPKNDTLRIQAYQSKILLKKHAAALREIEVLINHRPDEAQLYYDRARLKDTLKDQKGCCQDMLLAMKKGKDEAVDFINARCPVEQKSKEFKYYELIRAGMKQETEGEYEKAIATYDQAILLDPKGAIAYYNRGISNRKLLNFKEAIDDYLKAIEREPRFTVAYTSAAVAAHYLNDYEGAIRYNFKAIEVDSSNAMSYYNIAGIYWEQKNYTGALELLEKAIHYKKDYAKAYTLMGECLEMLNQEEKACYCYRAGEFYGDREATGKRVWACRKQ